MVSSPLAAAAWVLPLLAHKRRVRDESLHRMDAQLRRVAGAPIRDAECEAVAAQIVLDALPQARDVPPVVFPPSVRRRKCCLPPLAQLHNAKDRSPATLARLSRRRRPLPGVRGLDAALQLQREQLTAARDAAQSRVSVVCSSPPVRSALDFCDGWQRFRVWASKRSACATRGAARAGLAPTVRSTIVKRMSSAAKRQAAAEACVQQAAEAAAVAILRAHPVLVRAATAIRVRSAVRAACVAAGGAVARANAVASRVHVVPPARARRAQVLAEVVRSRPVLAVAAARGCPRPREGDVRRADGRRVVKAARVGDVPDTIRTVVAAQCGGGKSGRDSSTAETHSGARCCP